MPNMLIVYHSRTGNTEKLAQAIADGARGIAGLEVNLKRYNEATNDDLLKADAILMGSPTYFSLMSAEIKRFIDQSGTVYRRLGGKKGAYFTSAANLENGKSALQAFKLVYSHYHIDIVGEGIVCLRAPTQEKIAEATELGRRIGEMLV